MVGVKFVLGAAVTGTKCFFFYPYEGYQKGIALLFRSTSWPKRLVNTFYLKLVKKCRSSKYVLSVFIF